MRNLSDRAGEIVQLGPVACELPNASFEEIEENGFNLNITRYVDTFEEEAEIDIVANIAELEKLNPELEKLEAQMKDYLNQLGIK